MEGPSNVTDEPRADISASSPNTRTVTTETVLVSENGHVVRKTKAVHVSSIQSASGLNAIQNLGNPEEPDLTIFVTDPSLRRSKINKQAYIKLHRSSLKSNRSSVEILKGKYEDIRQSSDKGTPSGYRYEPVAENTKATNRSATKFDTDNKPFIPVENTDSDDKIIQCEYIDVELRKKKPSPEDVVTNIEQLQSRLSTKLNKETVETLKNKYSPASFGYPKIKDRSSKELSLKENEKPPKLPEKPPVPPRISSILSSSSSKSDTDRRSATLIGSVRGTADNIKPNARPYSTIERSPAQINYENIEFFEPEEKNIIVRQSSSEDSIEQLENFLADFTMDKKKVKEIKEKKRSSSFRKILTGSFFGKDKRKTSEDKKIEVDRNGEEDKKNAKKTENAVFSDNFQNEYTFNRSAAQRHTVDFPKSEHKTKAKIDDSQKYVDDSSVTSEAERRYAERHINHFNQIKANFSNPENFRKSSAEDYIHMDGSNEKKSKEMNYLNTSSVDRYIDTSSSSNTLDSDNRGTYENALIAQAEMKQLRELEIRKPNQNKLVKDKEKNVSPLRHRPLEQNHTKSPERFSQTPPRAQETYQNLQLVKPKAIIPINSERPLPNPYHNGQEERNQELSANVQAKTIERNLNVDGKEYPIKPTLYSQNVDATYGTVFGKRAVANLNDQKQGQYSQSQEKPSNNAFFPNTPVSPNLTARISPKSPTLETSKLRLPPNREKVNLQPRIKSPIPQPKVSTDKIIATELLKNKPESKKSDKRTSPSHQRFEFDMDYPDNNFSERKQLNQLDEFAANVSHQRRSIHDINSTADAFEAALWQQKQRELAKSPSMLTDESSQVVTDATVHVDSPLLRNNRQYGSLPPTSRSRPVDREVMPVRQRSITPVRRIPSTASLQVSPQKHEIRQSVQIYCWKELQKLKEKQDQELKCQLQYTPYGYVEDPIIVRRSRSTEPNQQRNGRRSASLPREAQPPQLQDRNVTGRNYHREVIPENRPIIYGEDDIYAQKNPNFMRGSPQRRSVTGGTIQKLSPTYEGYYSNNNAPRPIFNRGSLNPLMSLQMQDQLNKKVSFSGTQNPENPQSWPTKNGYVQSPPQRRVDKGFSVSDDEVFLPNKTNTNQKHVESPLYVTQTELRQSGTKLNGMPRESPYGSRQMLTLPKQNMINEEYVTRQKLIDLKQKESFARNAQTQRQNEVNQLYDGRQNMQQDYGVRQNEQNLNVPSARTNLNDSIYAARDYQINESPYGTRPTQLSVTNQPYAGVFHNTNESPYGTRSNPSSKGSLSPRKDSQQVLGGSQYGWRQNQQPESPYGSRQIRNVIESPYVSKGQTPLQSYPAMYPIRQQGLTESPYAIRQSAQMIDSPYGSARDNRQISGESTYDIRQNARVTTNESPYETRQTVRQTGTPKESPYASRQSVQSNANVSYSPRQNATDGMYGRNTPKQMTMSDKVCDMYGQIHDTGNRKPVSPTTYSHVQQTGVIYGQLQPVGSVLDKPPQYQSYNQMPSNFARGTRLTASANDMHKRYQADPRYRTEEIVYRRQVTEFNPNAPLPPLPNDGKARFLMKRAGTRAHQPISDTESDTSEVRRIMNKNYVVEEEWNSDGKSGRGIPGSESGSGRGENDIEIRGRSRNARRDDPRRHTLAGDQQYGNMDRQGGPLSRTMDLEGQPRGYPPPTNPMLFDDDPGIMSEVETSSTGFRRGGKQRSSLPVVRTPSKTLERPLGLVFLQYRNETKRALLPNEITSIDTVKALFVRSFPKQLTMEYLDSPQVKIYIHDSSKDMFYELEDLRSHLREIRDRSVLRLFESADVSGGLPMAGIGIAGGVGHFEDPSYFSEPEFDSEYQHQHIHKSKGSAGKGAPYYMGSTASLPRSGLLRAYSPAVTAIPPERLKALPTDGYMSSPERGSRYEDPYYSQYTTRSGSITPVIDEEVSDTELLDESYSLYGVKLPSAGPRTASRTGFAPPVAVPYDTTRRVENMERQLANLTGLVQKALTQAPPTLQVPGGRDNYRSDKSVSFEKSVSFSDEPPDMNSPKQHSPQHTERDRLKPAPPPKPASLSPGQYDGRHIYRDLQLTPEMYNQLRGLQKKAKDLRAEVRNLRRMSQAQAHSVRETIRDTFIKIRSMLLAGGEQVWQAGMDQERVRLSREEDLYKQEMLRLEKDLSDLESTVEELRGNVINRKTRVNMSDVENMALILSKSSKTVADLKLRFPSLQDSMKAFLSSEMEKVVREEKFLKEEPERLESALRRCKKLTGTLVTLKRLASVQEQRLPCATSANDGRLSPSITDTPPITPTSAQHSKPTPSPRVGQIVVGGDSANSSDSNQRPENALDALLDELQTFSKPHPSTVSTQMPQVTYPESEPPTLPIKGIPPSHSSHFTHPPSMSEIGRKGSMDSATILPTQNLTVSTATGSLRRLHSYPSGSDTDNSPPIQPLQRVQVDNKATSGKPPLPERNTELLQHISGKRIPPPPPPRTSSKSPLASPTSPSLPPRSPATGLQHIQNVQNMVDKPQSQFELATQNLGLSTLRRNVANRSSIKDRAQTLPRNIGSNLQVQTDVENAISASNSSSCESVNSQDGTKKRKEELEQRHQELLKKQKALQEQYARLQQLQRGNNTLAVVPPAPDQLLKKTGSESNLLQKMGLQMSAPQMTGSLTNLPNSGTTPAIKVSNTSLSTNTQSTSNTGDDSTASSTSSTTTSKVYETDIL